MTRIETEDFLLKYRDSFIRLSEIIKEVDTVRSSRYSEYSPEVRMLAIELLEEWIKTEFALSREDTIILPTKDEENLFLSLEKESYMSK